jgi:predicted RNA-binding protein with PUA-like domain
MSYWLLKTEPETFSWDDLVRDKKAVWDGVRNFQARKNIKDMKKGDVAFIYHTGDQKAIVGISSVTKEAYPEPKDPEWMAVDLAPDKPLKNPVTLARVRLDKSLQKMVLVRAARLSVQPVTKAEFERIIELSQKP